MSKKVLVSSLATRIPHKFPYLLEEMIMNDTFLEESGVIGSHINACYLMLSTCIEADSCQKSVLVLIAHLAHIPYYRYMVGVISIHVLLFTVKELLLKL